MARNLPKYVGDPFVDAGVAVLEIRSNLPFDQFTEETLEQQAKQLEDQFATKAMLGYLTIHFPNSGWCNPTMGPDKRVAFRNRVLRSFDFPLIGNRKCVYCRNPAQHLVDRSFIPLITGEATMTSTPHGSTGLPVCAACLFSIQFYPLATRKVKGKALFWWNPQGEWMFYLSSFFHNELEKQLAGSPEKLDNISWPYTRLMECIQAQIARIDSSVPKTDLIACHITNYGSDPSFEEIRIPASLLRFLERARGYAAFENLIRNAQEKPITKKGKSPEPIPFPRNDFYEDLLQSVRVGMPDLARSKGAIKFGWASRTLFHRHFIPLVRRREVGAFELAEFFCEEILTMTKAQIQSIKDLADRIAIAPKSEKHLTSLFKQNYPRQVLAALNGISDRISRGGGEAIPTDLVLSAFDLASEDESPASEFGVAHQLLLLRLIEKITVADLPEISEDSDILTEHKELN